MKINTQQKMKKLCAVICVSGALVGTASAATPGAYVGLGLGSSRIETPNQYLFEVQNGEKSRSLGGLGGRVFGGYNFNKYVGIETGYSRYARSLYKGRENTGNSSIEYSLSALDVVGKGYLPLGESNFNLYVLGGLAYVNNNVDYKNGGVALAQDVTAPKEGSHTNSKIRPKMGLGVSYDISPNVTTNLEYSRIQGMGNVKTSNSAIPSADMLTLNVSYNFG